MPAYECECCNFTTSNKTDFSKHNLTKKHLKKYDEFQKSNKVVVENDAVSELSVSTVSEESFIMHLREEIAMLREQLQKKDERIAELIKYETESKMKDEIIAMLKQQNQQPIQQLIQQPIQQSDNVSLCSEKKKNTKTILSERQDAMTIQEFLDTFKDEMKNKHIMYLDVPNSVGVESERCILTKVLPNEYKEQNQLYIDTILEFLNGIPENKRPIYCSDKGKHTGEHTFWVHTGEKDKEKEWIKSDNIEKELIKVVNRLGKVFNSALYSTTLIAKETPKHFNKIYSKNPNDWLDIQTELYNIITTPSGPSIGDKQLYDDRDYVINKLKVKLSS